MDSIFKNWKLAGILVIVSVLFSLYDLFSTPLITLESESSEISYAQLSSDIVRTLFNVIIMINLIDFLNRYAGTNKLNITIYFLIIIDILFMASSVAGVLSQENYFALFAPLVGLVLYPITTIILGIKFIRVQNALFGLKNYIGSLYIISGLFMITILLSPLSSIASIATGLMMSVMFLSGAKNA